MAVAGSVLRGLALSLCLPLAAQAGDRAQFNPLGYSGDGRYFAFEQFGIQDGSGFPYSEIFLIDLDTDRFAGGSPFRVRIDTDGAGLGEARQQAIAAASAALVGHEIFTPARIIALNGDGQASQGLELTYGVPGFGLADVGPADADVNPASADLAWRNGVWVANGNLAIRHMGVPTVTIPMGTMRDTGMPMGLTFAGRGWDDLRLLQLACAFERTGAYRQPPPRTPQTCD